MAMRDKKKLITLISVLVIALISFIFSEVIPYFTKAKIGTASVSSEDLLADSHFLVHYIDVGQGDSTLIETPSGGFILIDAGTNDSEHKLLSYLDSRNVENIEYLILTHPHEDHIGSADSVLYDYYVKNVIVTDVRENNITCERLDKAIEDSKKHIGTNVIIPGKGDSFTCDGLEFLILSDGKGYEDVNDTSICLRMEYGKSTFIFTGDATKNVERDIINDDFDISAEVYKCAHHGSSSSSSDEFLNDISPDIAIISCEEGNDYGHPHREVMESLYDRGITVYRTDVQGDIVLRCSGKAIDYVTVQ